MKPLRQLALTFALWLPLIGPAMACVLPGAQMTAAEMACCKQMTAECGNATMPASHGCCHKEVANSGYLKTAYANVTLATAAVSGVAPTIQCVVTRDSFVLPGKSFVPQSPPGAISILRI